MAGDAVSAASHRVHGLAGDEAAPDWAPIEDAEAQRLLRAWPDLHGDARVTWRSPRPFSAAARVRAGNAEVFVKRHHPAVRGVADLREEHAFMAHLRRRGVPIPAVLSSAGGDTAVTMDGWTWEVHALAEGIDLHRERMSWSPPEAPEQARHAGRMLACLHRAAADYVAPPRAGFMLMARADLLRAPDLFDALQRQLPRRPALADYLRQRDWRVELADVAARQRAVQPRLAALPRCWTHGDWHVSNLCWSDAGPAARVTDVLDFGLATKTFALFDLATAIERNAIAWTALERGADAVRPRIAEALLAGYAELLPLPAEARTLLAALLPVVHLDFALSEVEYYHGVTHSDANADVAWNAFLRGHAAWFDTAPGRALLETVRGNG